jgi:predicted DNA-binding transcriptional regulator AlpA
MPTHTALGRKKNVDTKEVPSLLDSLTAGRFVEPLAVDAATAARMCGVSRANWYALKASGRIPPPIRIGWRTLWRVDDLKKWVALGCPPLHRWNQIVVDR